MNKILCRLGLFLALALGTASAHAQLKIGTVDLGLVFTNYYKTKQADVVLKERAADLDKAYKGMLEDYQKANEEYKKLLDGANDQAVSTDERERRKKQAETKLLEIRDTEQQIRQFRATSQDTLTEEKRRKRDAILKEIRDLIIRKGKAGNYTLLFDVSGESLAGVPVALYSSGQNDMTEEILRELNAGAPPDLLNSPGSGGSGSDRP